jgi:hypothetical protein
VSGWFLRSMSDGDTHRGIYSPASLTVQARCGAEFEPLKKTNGAPIMLVPVPPDPVNDPQSWLDRLVGTVLLRRIVTLAEQAPTLPDSELADRLQMLAGCGR